MDIKTSHIQILELVLVPQQWYQEMSSINQQALDTLKSVTPNWDISTVIEEVHAVYQSQELSQEQKQQAINATINKYARAAQPLYKFLKENNFPTPDTAQ